MAATVDMTITLEKRKVLIIYIAALFACVSITYCTVITNYKNDAPGMQSLPTRESLANAQEVTAGNVISAPYDRTPTGGGYIDKITSALTWSVNNLQGLVGCNDNNENKFESHGGMRQFGGRMFLLYLIVYAFIIILASYEKLFDLFNSKNEDYIKNTAIASTVIAGVVPVIAFFLFIYSKTKPMAGNIKMGYIFLTVVIFTVLLGYAIYENTQTKNKIDDAQSSLPKVVAPPPTAAAALPMKAAARSQKNFTDKKKVAKKPVILNASSRSQSSRI
jgi:nitrate reductase gamma subunit